MGSTMLAAGVAALVTAAIAAGSEHFILAPARAKMEYRLQTGPQIRTLYNLATVGRYVTEYVVIIPPAPAHLLAEVARDEQVLVSSLGFPVSSQEDTVILTLPAFVADAGFRKRWESLQAQLDSQPGDIDPVLFREYEKLRLFLLEHPLPASDTLDPSIVAWSEVSVREEWKEINDRICCMADRVMKLTQRAEDRSIRGVVRFAAADHRTNDDGKC